jgi:hypothetical protein
MSDLPKSINVMKVISYDVQQIVEDIMARDEIEASAVDMTKIMEYVDTLVDEDFDTSKDYLLYQDENGEEIDDK